MPDRWTMRHVNVARGAAWLAASSLLAAACSSGGPLENSSFGFNPMAMTTDEDPTAGSVGTFEPDGSTAETAASMDDTAGSTSGETTMAGPLCSDGVLEAPEACDGMDLGGEDCLTQGFDGGTLACADDCTLDASGCTMFACGNGVVEGVEVCDGVDLGGEDCTSQGFDVGTLACTVGCNAFDTAGCSFDCAEQNIGSSVGSPVTSGSTVGEDEDLAQSCGAGGVDYVLRFTAPAAATFQFDTLGSAYDTVLSLHTMCGGAEVACNDDSSGGLQSLVTYPLAAGQELLIAVSGFDGNTGSWVLNIVQL